MSLFGRIIIAASLVLAGHAQAHGRVRHHVVRHVRYHHAGRSGPAPYCPAPLPGVLCEHESGRAIDQPHANAPRQDGSNPAYWQAERSRQTQLSGNSGRLAAAALGGTVRALDGIWVMIVRSAQAHGVPAAVAVAIVRQESGGRCTARNGHAVGLMQLMPQTARALGVRDRMDCAQNLDGGIRMLASIGARYGWSCAALSLYERGEAARPKCTPYGLQVERRMSRG